MTDKQINKNKQKSSYLVKSYKNNNYMREYPIPKIKYCNNIPTAPLNLQNMINLLL